MSTATNSLGEIFSPTRRRRTLWGRFSPLRDGTGVGPPSTNKCAKIRLPTRMNMQCLAHMDALDYWKLCDAVSVVQAALLIVGEDPAAWQESIGTSMPGEPPLGYVAAKTALVSAITSNQLPAKTPPFYPSPALIDLGIYTGEDEWEPDWDNATIRVDDLRTWLRSRGFKTGFFFPLPEGPDYLSDSH